MNKHEFDSKLRKTFTFAELSLINPIIYFNEEHIDYYLNFKIGNYEECYDYLIENKSLLVIENLPEDHKDYNTYLMMYNQSKLFDV